MSPPPEKRNRREGRREPSSYEQLFHLLQTRPLSTANEILRRIRTGTDPQSIVCHVNEGDLLIQLSLQPNMQYKYNLPYAADLSPLFNRPNNPYARSRLFQLTFEDKTLTKLRPSPDLSPAQAHRHRLYEVPYHVACIVDPGINAAAQHLPKWTSVASDYTLLRKLLETYFQHEYPFYHFFHKDSFLQDLVAEREDFCTSLLVNSILASACNGVAMIKDRLEWDPKTFGFLFLAEAKRLWELEVGKAKLTTVQAALIIGMTYAQNAMDKIGSAYWSQAIVMAEQMGLFQRLDSSLDERSRIAQTVTVWSLFNLESTISFFYFREPVITSPPKAALPSREKASQWFGDIWLLYPRSEVLVPSCLGLTFLAFCDLYSITNEIAQHDRKGQIDESIPIEQVSKYYKRLKRWRENLPAPLLPAVVVLPVHLLLHMLYNTIISKTFSPLQAAEMTFNAPNTSSMFIDYLGYSPTQVVSNVQTCLETLLHMFYRLHGSEAWCTFLMNTLSHVAFNALQKLYDNRSGQPRNISEIDALRATLILCSKGLKDQGRNNGLAEILFRLLIDNMRPEDVALLKDGAKLLDESNKRKSMMNSRSHHPRYPVDFACVTPEVSQKSVDRLVEAMQDVEILGIPSQESSPWGFSTSTSDLRGSR